MPISLYARADPTGDVAADDAIISDTNRVKAETGARHNSAGRPNNAGPDGAEQNRQNEKDQRMEID